MCCTATVCCCCVGQRLHNKHECRTLGRSLTCPLQASSGVPCCTQDACCLAQPSTALTFQTSVQPPGPPLLTGFTWDGMLHKMPGKQWQTMLDVHCTAPFRLIQARGRRAGRL